MKMFHAIQIMLGPGFLADITYLYAIKQGILREFLVHP